MMVFLKIDTINNFQDLNLKYYDYYYCLYFDNFDMQKIDSFDFIMKIIIKLQIIFLEFVLFTV